MARQREPAGRVTRLWHKDCQFEPNWDFSTQFENETLPGHEFRARQRPISRLAGLPSVEIRRHQHAAERAGSNYTRAGLCAAAESRRSPGASGTGRRPICSSFLVLRRREKPLPVLLTLHLVDYIRSDTQIFRTALAALSINLDLIRDRLPLGQPGQTGALNSAYVHKNILAAVIGLDETKSLGRIEPLHNTRRHVHLRVKQYDRVNQAGPFPQDRSPC